MTESSREGIAVKEAIARGGLWFFGTVIVIWLFFPKFYEKDPLGEQVFKMVFAGFIVGGAMFCKEWYEKERDDRIRASKQDTSDEA